MKTRAAAAAFCEPDSNLRERVGEMVDELEAELRGHADRLIEAVDDFSKGLITLSELRKAAELRPL